MGMLKADVVSEAEVEQAMHHFDAIDVDNSNTLDQHELEFLLITFQQGQHAAKVSRHAPGMELGKLHVYPAVVGACS